MQLKKKRKKKKARSLKLPFVLYSVAGTSFHTKIKMASESYGNHRKQVNIQARVKFTINIVEYIFEVVNKLQQIIFAFTFAPMARNPMIEFP